MVSLEPQSDFSIPPVSMDSPAGFSACRALPHGSIGARGGPLRKILLLESPQAVRVSQFLPQRRYDHHLGALFGKDCFP